MPIVSRLPVYEELAEDYGLLFEPGDVDVLAAQLRRVIADAGLRERLRATRRAPRTWARVADEVEASTPRSSAAATTRAGDPRCGSG